MPSFYQTFLFEVFFAQSWKFVMLLFRILGICFEVDECESEISCLDTFGTVTYNMFVIPSKNTISKYYIFKIVGLFDVNNRHVDIIFKL